MGKIGSIKDVLIKRDGYTSEEAELAVQEAKRELMDMIENDNFSFSDLDTFCEEHFGLEPDYMDELLLGI